MKSKPSKKPKHIKARSITLEDAKGKPRIFMDAGDGNAFATICVFGERQCSIQISSQPDGSLSIMLYNGKSQATFVMMADGKSGINLRDQEGLLGTLLGANGMTGDHELSIFRKGQLYWTTRTPKKKSARAKKKAGGI